MVVGLGIAGIFTSGMKLSCCWLVVRLLGSQKAKGGGEWLLALTQPISTQCWAAFLGAFHGYEKLLECLVGVFKSFIPS